MSQEVEIKLSLSPDELLQLETHPLLASVPRETFQIKNDYYDSHDFKLRRQGAAVRIRQKDARYLFTYKHGGRVVGGLAQRHEYEVPIESNQLQQHLLDDCQLQIDVAQLKKIFSTNFTRQQWLLDFGESQIECVYDQGTIQAGEHSLPISEVELELRHGNIDDLYQCGFELMETVPLRMESLSKAARGYFLLGHRFKKPVIDYNMPVDLSQIDKKKLLKNIFSIWQRAQMWQTLCPSEDNMKIYQQTVADLLSVAAAMDNIQLSDNVEKNIFLLSRLI